MKVIGPKQQSYRMENSWQVITGKGLATYKSDLHISARKLLQELFPTVQIFEEVPIAVTTQKNLFLDFYIPLQNTCHRSSRQTTL